MRNAVLIAASLALTGCGTVAKNADVGLVSVGKAPLEQSASDTAVSVSKEAPPAGAATADVTGYSCKNKLWDPAPTEENAIAMMKRDAMKRGAAVIYSVSVKKDPASAIVNCWSGIRATGKVAINP